MTKIPEHVPNTCLIFMKTVSIFDDSSDSNVKKKFNEISRFTKVMLVFYCLLDNAMFITPLLLKQVWSFDDFLQSSNQRIQLAIMR